MLSLILRLLCGRLLQLLQLLLVCHFGFYSFELCFRFRTFHVVLCLRFRKLGFHLRFYKRAVIYNCLLSLRLVRSL